MIVSLTRDSDFVRLIEAAEGYAFPADMSLVLDFGNGTVWPATVTPTSASWNVDKAESNALADLAPEQARLRYQSGDSDRIWAQGPVIIYG